MYGGRSKGFSGRSSGKTAVHGNILLPVLVYDAEGLQNCKKMLQMAKAGKYNGYLLEGMACPGGCVAGAGTLQVVKKAAAALEKMKGEASFTESSDSKYQSRLESLEKFDVE